MNDRLNKVAVIAEDISPRQIRSVYPEPFASMLGGRTKRALGAVFGLTNFGVNLTELTPGAISALRHAHTRQDEFIYILEGSPILRTDAGDTPLSPGMCAGFKAGCGDAHQLLNLTTDTVRYLEIGDRTPGDIVRYPEDDLQAISVDGRWEFAHKDGRPYEE